MRKVGRLRRALKQSERIVLCQTVGLKRGDLLALCLSGDGARRKTKSLPTDLVREAEKMTRAQGKTLTEVIQDALRIVTAEQRKQKYRDIQDYWGRKAMEHGILNEGDLDLFLTRLGSNSGIG